MSRLHECHHKAFWVSQQGHLGFVHSAIYWDFTQHENQFQDCVPVEVGKGEVTVDTPPCTLS